jgi:sentrin-specific protease 1
MVDNEWDCGVFVWMFADFLSRDRPLTFSQDDMNNYRNRISHSLLNKKIDE